jgi:hypothetical protein
MKRHDTEAASNVDHPQTLRSYRQVVVRAVGAGIFLVPLAFDKPADGGSHPFRNDGCAAGSFVGIE